MDIDLSWVPFSDVPGFDPHSGFGFHQLGASPQDATDVPRPIHVESAQLPVRMAEVPMQPEAMVCCLPRIAASIVSFSFRVMDPHQEAYQKRPAFSSPHAQ
jgi:phage head maturation protease